MNTAHDDGSQNARAMDPALEAELAAMRAERRRSLLDPLLPTAEEMQRNRVAAACSVNGAMGAKRYWDSRRPQAKPMAERKERPAKAAAVPKEPRRAVVRTSAAPKPPRRLAATQKPGKRPRYDVAAFLRDCDDPALTTKAIAARHGISVRTVCVTARANGKPRPRFDLGAAGYIGNTQGQFDGVRDQIAADRKAGMILADIRAKYGCSNPVIIAAAGRLKPRPAVLTDAELAARWEARASSETLARELNWHKDTLRKRAETLGFDMTPRKPGRPRNQNVPISDEEVETIRQLVPQIGVNATAKRMGRDRSGIWRRWKEMQA